MRFKQEDLFQRGHAIECRICAEDTENGFIPCPGIIRQLTEPNGIGVRIDSYVYEGYEIPLYYDPMIGKLIVWATNRQFAIERMRRVLYEFKITGLKTNISYLRFCERRIRHFIPVKIFPFAATQQRRERRDRKHGHDSRLRGLPVQSGRE